MIVLDASAAVEWLLGLPLAAAVGERLRTSETLHAPHLVAIEVAQVIRRYVGRGEVAVERGTQAIVDLADLDVAHHPHEPLLPVIWRRRHNLTAYDAAYVALAEVLDAPLLTLDAGIASAGTPRARVELIS